MPIPFIGAGRPPVVTPDLSVPPKRRVLQLVGSNGDEITLTDRAGGYQVLKTKGLFGFEPVNVQLRDAGSGVGATYERTQYPARPIDLALRVSASEPADLYERVARLGRALDGRWGESLLRVISPYEGRSRVIACRYAGGAEGDTGGGEGDTFFQNVPVSLVAPFPYFRDERPTTVVWRRDGGGKALVSPTGLFFPVLLRRSQVLGSVAIDNPGDVEAPAVWTIHGPGGPTEVRLNGYGFTVSHTLTDTDVLTVDAATRQVVDQSGTNRYDWLSPAPKFWPIPAGVSVAEVSVGSASDATSVTLSYFPRYRVAV